MLLTYAEREREGGGREKKRGAMMQLGA